jgi:hypothetical protein
MGPDGKIDPIAELLSQQNEILEDVVFKEANQPTSHFVTVRTGLPSVYWRAYNQGVPSSKSHTAQITEPCAMLEARSHIDAKLLDDFLRETFLDNHLDALSVLAAQTPDRLVEGLQGAPVDADLATKLIAKAEELLRQCKGELRPACQSAGRPGVMPDEAGHGPTDI